MSGSKILELLESPELISRKIWVVGKSWNFYTVFHTLKVANFATLDTSLMHNTFNYRTKFVEMSVLWLYCPNTTISWKPQNESQVVQNLWQRVFWQKFSARLWQTFKAARQSCRMSKLQENVQKQICLPKAL